MKNKTIRKCPGCDQKLRFPDDVGGLVMICPSCGKKFYSDFKVRGSASQPPRIMEEGTGSGGWFRQTLRWFYNNCFCFWFK